MSEQKSKKCLVCGKEYEACGYCDSQNEFYAWRNVCDTRNCYAFHLPIIMYIRKQITKREAQKELKYATEYNNGIIPNMTPSVLKVYNQIMYQTKAKRSHKKDSEEK